MKNNSITKVFWGLLLIFFDINICHLNLLTTFIGALLLATGIWQLVQVNRNLKFAFAFSLIQLAVQTSSLVLICMQKSGNLSVTISGSQTADSNVGVVLFITVAGTLSSVLLICFLFEGLHDIAVSHNNQPLGSSLNRCIWLYIITAALIIAIVFIPYLLIIALIFVIINYIYILAQVNRLSKALDPNDETPECRLDRRYFAALGCFLTLIVISLSVALITTNNPSVHTNIYNKGDTAGQLEINSIRDHMVKLGFDKKILNDLPDSEVKYYKDIHAFHELISSQQTDGGTITMTECISSFTNGAFRILEYYKWNKMPNHCYSDVFSFDVNSQIISMPQNINLDGFGLYDVKTKERVQTFKADFVHMTGVFTDISTYPKIQYRVFDRSKINQRGFIAFDAQIADYSNPLDFNVIINYSHQTNIFNFDGTNEFYNNNQIQTSFDSQGGYWQLSNSSPYGYDMFQFCTVEQYEPKQYKLLN